ncbi:MAG: hypothetical protein JSV52_07150 [Candidatus Zixiibacteriota bacterium]|nr:MAG: hypothetical protein JSV52_07150 [candidate division Zixibacteria bacterium]
MFGVKDISVSFLSGSPLVVWLTAALLVLLAVYLYRRTNPPLPVYMKVILAVLRIIAVLALVFTLAEPVIGFTRQFERDCRVAVLIDVSGSMDKTEAGKKRSERLDSLMASPDFNGLKGNAEVSTFFFGENLSPEEAEVKRDKTALGDALELLQTRQIAEPSDYWILFSDGNSNSGQQPRRAAGRLTQPVVAVDMASDTGSFDIGIAEVNYNPVLFVGQPTEINVRLTWQNVSERNLPLELSDSVRTVVQKTFQITQAEGLGEVALSYTPSEPGQKILRVQIPTDAKEENPGNNQRSFSVKVLKSRLLVLMVTGQPDYEIGFLKRLLEQSEKYQVELVVTGSKSGNLVGRIPSRQTEMNRYDLIVLHDPDPKGLESRRAVLESYLSERGGAVWVLMGGRFSERGPVGWFNDLLPFYPSFRHSIEYAGFRGEPSESHLFHPAVRLADGPTDIREAWASLPPFQALVKCDRIHPEAVVLARAAFARRDQSKYPILGYRRFGPGKLMASAALPFWTWGFVNLGFGEDPGDYADFAEGTMSWLTVSDDLEPIRIKPEKDVFHRGEVVRFDGFAFDLGFRPIPGVTGTIGLISSKEHRSYETDLVAKGGGAYRGELFNVSPGSYTYRAIFEKDGRTLKESVGSIVVETFSVEEVDQGGDPATLAAVSRLSGGSYFRFGQFADAIAALDLTPVAINEKAEITLLNKLWLLFIFMLAVCIEWLVRKINQLL